MPISWNHKRNIHFAFVFIVFVGCRSVVTDYEVTGGPAHLY